MTSEPGNVSQFACGNGYPAPFGALAADTRCARKRNHGGDHQGEDQMGRVQRWSNPPYVVPESSSDADMDAAWDQLHGSAEVDYPRLADRPRVDRITAATRLLVLLVALSIAPAVAIIMWRVAL